MQRPAKTVDIDQMIESLPQHEQVLVKRLRALVTECIPQAMEKAYEGLAMPFYTRNRIICFIWPPSLAWEPNANLEKQRAKGVALCFNQGNLMSNENGLLLAEGRKQVYKIYFKKLADIDEKQVRSLLFEAAMIDEQFAKKKKN